MIRYTSATVQISKTNNKVHYMKKVSLKAKRFMITLERFSYSPKLRVNPLPEIGDILRLRSVNGYLHFNRIQ